MKYRVLPHGGEQISVLGIGASSIQASDEKEIEETIRFAVENGINFARFSCFLFAKIVEYR